MTSRAKRAIREPVKATLSALERRRRVASAVRRPTPPHAERPAARCGTRWNGGRYENRFRAVGGRAWAVCTLP
jgi:hypothetical protein